MSQIRGIMPAGDGRNTLHARGFRVNYWLPNSQMSVSKREVGVLEEGPQQGFLGLGAIERPLDGLFEIHDVPREGVGRIATLDLCLCLFIPTESRSVQRQPRDHLGSPFRPPEVRQGSRRTEDLPGASARASGVALASPWAWDGDGAWLSSLRTRSVERASSAGRLPLARHSATWCLSRGDGLRPAERRPRIAGVRALRVFLMFRCAMISVIQSCFAQLLRHQ
jgi:hypothetical protein